MTICSLDQCFGSASASCGSRSSPKSQCGSGSGPRPLYNKVLVILHLSINISTFFHLFIVQGDCFIFKKTDENTSICAKVGCPGSGYAFRIGIRIQESNYLRIRIRNTRLNGDIPNSKDEAPCSEDDLL